jgi:hypothetical protein
MECLSIAGQVECSAIPPLICNSIDVIAAIRRVTVRHDTLVNALWSYVDKINGMAMREQIDLVKGEKRSNHLPRQQILTDARHLMLYIRLTVCKRARSTRQLQRGTAGNK